MSKSSLPQRVAWPKLLPDFARWWGIVGGLLSAISLILTGSSGLNLSITGSLFLIILVGPIIIPSIWKIARFVWLRVKQYDLLYENLSSAILYNQRLQENNSTFVQKTLISAGIQIFEVTKIMGGTTYPLLVIDCNGQMPVGTKLIVIDRFTLDALGEFKIVQKAATGGYFAREERIVDAMWWGFLHSAVANYPHSPITNAIAFSVR